VHFSDILFIAAGLSMDALAVAISCGLAIRQLHLKHAFRIALFFGLFQALMPSLGWLAGIGFKRGIESFDHWVAFALLALIGGKMVYEAFHADDGVRPEGPPGTRRLLTLAVATSIDALAVGVVFACSDVLVAGPALIIGAVTFTIALAGVYIGERAGRRSRRGAEVMGGLILIGIGIKILVEHLRG
jgi:manganese efflux pump family protein